MSTRIQKKTGFVDLLSKNESHIKASIPPKMVSAGLTPSFVIRSILGAINNSDQLRRIASSNPISVMKSCLTAVQLGLTISSGNQSEAHLIPRGNQVTLSIGWRGLRTLAINSGQVRSIQPTSVMEKDQFKYQLGSSPDILHIPWQDMEDGDAGQLRFVYAIARMTDGSQIFEVWNRTRLENHRKKFAPNSKIWRDHFEQMAYKTVIISLCKHLPIGMGFEDNFQKAVSLAELQSVNVPEAERKSGLTSDFPSSIEPVSFELPEPAKTPSKETSKQELVEHEEETIPF